MATQVVTPPTQNWFRQSARSIPDWMLRVDRVLAGKPAATMRNVGVPTGWLETWEAMASSLQMHGAEASEINQAIELTVGDLPLELIDRIRRASLEPLCPPLTTVHLVATGRGLLMLVAPPGLLTNHMQDGIVHVHPWGRPDLPGITQCRGEAEALDSANVRPWLWAAWRQRVLMMVMEPPAPPEGLEVTIPDFLAMQAARQVVRRM